MNRTTLIAMAVGSILGTALPGAYAQTSAAPSNAPIVGQPGPSQAAVPAVAQAGQTAPTTPPAVGQAGPAASTTAPAVGQAGPGAARPDDDQNDIQRDRADI